MNKISSDYATLILKRLVIMQTKNKDILSLEQIKNIVVPILKEYHAQNIYLFGSYARNEANENSDVDIYCDRGDIIGLLEICEVIDVLKEKLNKDVDLLFDDMTYEDSFKQSIEKDLVKLD